MVVGPQKFQVVICQKLVSLILRQGFGVGGLHGAASG